MEPSQPGEAPRQTPNPNPNPNPRPHQHPNQHPNHPHPHPHPMPPNPRKRPHELSARFPPLNKLPTALLCTCTTEHDPAPPAAVHFTPSARRTAAPVTTMPPHSDLSTLRAAVAALPADHCRDVLASLSAERLQAVAYSVALADEGVAARLLERHGSLFAPAPAAGSVRFDKIVEHVKASVGSLKLLLQNDLHQSAAPLQHSIRQTLFVNISTIHSYAMPSTPWRARANALATLLDLARWMADQLRDIPALHPPLLSRGPLGQAFVDICRAMTRGERAAVMSSVFGDVTFGPSLRDLVKRCEGSAVFPELAEALAVLEEGVEGAEGVEEGEEDEEGGHPSRNRKKAVPPDGWPRPDLPVEASPLGLTGVAGSAATKEGKTAPTPTPKSPSTSASTATAKDSAVISFEKEFMRLKHSYWDRHAGKQYPEQVTAGSLLARQIMNAVRKSAAKATLDAPWQTRANMLLFMYGVMDMVSGGNGLPLGSAVRQEFYMTSKEFIRTFRSIVGNMTDAEKHLLRAWKPPRIGGTNNSSLLHGDSCGGNEAPAPAARTFDELLEAMVAATEEVQVFYDLDKCLELLRGGHPLFLRCEEGWCVSNLFKRRKEDAARRAA